MAQGVRKRLAMVTEATPTWSGAFARTSPFPSPAADLPDLASYDVIEASSSAGKDSLAMLAYLAWLLKQRGLMDRAVVVHADLGRVEWPGTAVLAEEQARHLGFQFEKIKRPQGDLLEHVEQLGKWPMPTQRYCTADHKRGQIYVLFTALAKRVRAAWEGLAEPPHRPVRILNCIGLRAEESPKRAKRPVLKRDPKPSGVNKEVDVWLPIQHWKEQDVWRACRASGARMHPAYAAGLPRASCVLCIFAPRDALIVAGRLHPDLLAEYVRVEKAIGHSFTKELPIAQVAADIEAGVVPSGPIRSWCM